jgi:hypothetical protein
MSQFAGAPSARRILKPALRKITEALAVELVSPGENVPEWSDIEWTVARAVAAMHGISPLLGRNLRWQGPLAWSSFLARQKSHTQGHCARIFAMLQLIGDGARAAGVPVMALKGAALHTIGLYAIGERPMADIDLLVRPMDAPRLVGVLKTLGFVESFANWKERVFIPVVSRVPDALGVHSDNDIKIELHERICEKLPWNVTDISQFMFPRDPHPGLNAYPCRAALMSHLLLHAAGTMPTRSLRLLNLHDIAELSATMSEQDWEQVLALRPSGQPPWWAFPPLKVASRYYPAKIPVDVLGAMAGCCPFLLRKNIGRRTLYDVSFSYPWVNAFPGIEWSRSIGELLGYAANRMRPTTRDFKLRSVSADAEFWMSRNEWTRLSQGRRILRFMTSRHMRPPTRYAIQAAFAQNANREP